MNTNLKHRSKPNKQKIMNATFKNILIMILIMSLCTGLSYLFKFLGMLESNIIMIYQLGILIFAFLVEGYIYSFSSVLCGVLIYNLCFIEPYYSFNVYSKDYVITFIVMFFVGFMTSMLTNKVRISKQAISDREKYATDLYNIEKKLLNVMSVEDLAKRAAHEIATQFNANVLVEFTNLCGEIPFRVIQGENVFHGLNDCNALLNIYKCGNPCGYGTAVFSNTKAYYMPIISLNKILGVVGIALMDNSVLTTANRGFMDALATQIAAVLERENNYRRRKESQIEMNKERLRADMLRTISHDLRTPLAAIMGMASTSIDHYDKLSDEVKRNFIKSIYEDAEWLSALVENVLQITKLEEGNFQLNIEEEAVEEIIIEAVTHVKKHAPEHKIMVKLPDEIILVKVDGVLIRQVLINILNNAVNYSSKESEIIVSLYRETNKVIFEIKDSGPGITEEILPHIFDRYYKKGTKKVGSMKGMGLGLPLCRSIIEAHNGVISVSNNEPHGAIVSFYLLEE